MNCKPGQLAVIKQSPIHEWLIDRVVTVLHAAPQRTSFELPDGYMHQVLRSERLWWVCEFPMEIPLPMSDQLLPRMGRFAPVPDEYLRPINNPGEDETDEMVLLVGKPDEVTA